MHIEIKRIHQIGENIEGHLLIDSHSDHRQNLQYVCDTLENHHSSLPPGQYRVEVVKCRFRSRKMPLLITPAHSPEPDLPFRLLASAASVPRQGTKASTAPPTKGMPRGRLSSAPCWLPATASTTVTTAASLSASEEPADCFCIP